MMSVCAQCIRSCKVQCCVKGSYDSIPGCRVEWCGEELNGVGVACANGCMASGLGLFDERVH